VFRVFVIAINIKNLTNCHSGSLTCRCHIPLFVEIKKREHTVDVASKYSLDFVPTQLLIHLPVAVRLVAPVLPCRLHVCRGFFYIVEHFSVQIMHAILVAERPINHKTIKSTFRREYPTYDISVFNEMQFKLID